MWRLALTNDYFIFPLYYLYLSDIPSMTAKINLEGPAQPYMPGPAIYQPPMTY